MRILVVAIALCGACKDKPAPAKKEPTAERQRPAERPSLETPEITGPGLVAATEIGPTVTYSKTDIKLDGASVAPLGNDGWIEPTRVQALVSQLEAKVNSDAPVAVTFDATVSYRHMGMLLDTLKRAGFRNIALLASKDKMIPIELPDAKEVNGVGLRPVVTLDRGQVKLWSASGEEGTRARPKLSFAVQNRSFEPLTRALAEIVQRRFPLGKRGDADKTIIIQPDGNQPADLVLQLLAAVRSDGSTELFPHIFLAGGA